MDKYKVDFGSGMDRVRISVRTEVNGRNAWENVDLTPDEAYLMSRLLEEYAEHLTD